MPLSFPDLILGPSVLGFTRIDTHFCIRNSLLASPVAFNGTIWTELDFTSHFTVIPTNLKYILINGVIVCSGNGTPNSLNGYSIQVGDGVTVFMSKGGKYFDVPGTAAAELTEYPIEIKAPIHGLPNSVLIWATGLSFGAGGQSAGLRVIGYWD